MPSPAAHPARRSGARPTAGSIAPSAALLESSPATWLRTALERLVTTTDGVAEAVIDHDLEALETAVARSSELVTALDAAGDRLVAARDDEDFAIAAPALRDLRERLRANGRRNANLIQRAWELDAAAVRLLIRIVAPESDHPTAAYASPAPRLLDTPA